MTVENPHAGQGSVCSTSAEILAPWSSRCRGSWRVSRWRSIASTLQTGAIAAAQNHDHLHSHDHHHLHDPAKNMITTESMIMSIHMIMRRTVHT